MLTDGITINGKKVPCGCEARREIMFTHGHAGVTELCVIGVAVLAMVVAWKFGRKVT